MAKRLLPSLRDAVRFLVDAPVTPRVHDDDDVRCLRFNSGVVQSSMHRSDPFGLVLSYTRAMMGFLLFNPDPREILIIGLGGGSLPKYCYRQFPRARITTVEISAEVIALRDEFLIPPDDERFRIVPADAAEYLARAGLRADVILLDGYDAAGLPPGLCSEAFYATCRQVLGDSGVLVANLWGGEPNRRVYLDRLRAVFGERVWWSKPGESSSVVVYALGDENYVPHWPHLAEAARALDARHRLDLAQAVRDMRRCPDPDD